MGRPDTLGADLYHNRRFPVTEASQSGEGRDIELLDHAHCAIIKCMVDLSRITKSICLRIYLPQVTLAAAIGPARELESQIEQWITALPEAIRPIVPSDQDLGLQRARDLQWMKRQRLVLTMSRFPSCVARTLDYVADRIQDITISESCCLVLFC
jgi:hypothetical protein